VDVFSLNFFMRPAITARRISSSWNWFCTRTWGAGRPHVWLCHAPLVVVVIRISIPLYGPVVSQPIVMKLFTQAKDNILHQATVAEFWAFLRLRGGGSCTGGGGRSSRNYLRPSPDHDSYSWLFLFRTMTVIICRPKCFTYLLTCYSSCWFMSCCKFTPCSEYQ